MTPETLAALRSSIEKWDKIAAQEGVDRGRENCPLCQRFRDADCSRCPVADKTGMAYCKETPFWDFYAAKPLYSVTLDGHYASTPEQIAAARAEANFLRSLLPDGEP